MTATSSVHVDDPGGGGNRLVVSLKKAPPIFMSEGMQAVLSLFVLITVDYDMFLFPADAIPEYEEERMWVAFGMPAYFSWWSWRSGIKRTDSRSR